MIETHQIELEKIKIAIVQRISNRLLDQIVEVSEIDSFIHDAIDLRLHGYLWGETAKAEPIQYPSDWWQAFKQRWFPRWALARWPVRLTTHHITLRTLYPNFRISMPSEAHVLKIETLKHEYTSTDYEN